jgi:hypothetical protein
MEEKYGLTGGDVMAQCLASAFLYVNKKRVSVYLLFTAYN